MPVEDVFTITGRGTVASGRIDRGTVKVGDEVDVRNTEVDFDKKRVSLSMKEVLPKPNADEAEADYADDAE